MLRSTDLASVDYAEDIRGRSVVDCDGRKVGRVDALFIDRAQKKVRFFRVASGGGSGKGASEFLIPVDAVARIEDGTVHLRAERGELAVAPDDRPEIADERHAAALYEHYGICPFWAEGYSYPPYPFYA
jgi:sporulation protein YlmC with PRC-barrel domain